MVPCLTVIWFYCSGETKENAYKSGPLSRMTNGEDLDGVHNDLPNAYLLTIKMASKWFEPIIFLLSIGSNQTTQIRMIEKNQVVFSSCKKTIWVQQR